MFGGTHSVIGSHTVYQGCCLTKRKVKIWKPKQMRICVITDSSKGAEIRPDGGRQETNSFHAAFRLTAKGTKQRKSLIEHNLRGENEIFTIVLFTDTLTGKNNEEDNGNINKEELKVSKVAEDLRNYRDTWPRMRYTCWISQLHIFDEMLHTE